MLDVALEVFEELRARRLEVDRLRRAQVDRAREEAELAKRQFMLVRPENRLVADALERQWNESLLRVAREEEEYARATKLESVQPSGDAAERVRGLAVDFPRVWKDPRRSARDRKRILRLLVEDVTQARVEKLIHVHVRWRGGATTSIEQPVPPKWYETILAPVPVVERIRALATKQIDGQIAATLNADHLLSGAGKIFTRLRVKAVRGSYGIESYHDWLRQQGWLTADEIALRLRLTRQTAKCYAREGLVRAVRADDKGTILFAPPQGPLPEGRRGKRLRDRCVFPKLYAQVRNEVQYET